MLVEIDGVASSTASTSPINNSTGLTVAIWRTATTASTANRLLTGAAMAYVSAGMYRYTAQSTGVAPTVGDRGMAIVTMRHAGLDGEWRAYFRAEYRGAT
jgi:hypothetical protein